VELQEVWMHPDDASARGIVHGQRVRVFNDNGVTVLPARVTDRIARGVVSIAEGAWFLTGADGVDSRGCVNVLTGDRASPSGATTYNTCRVEVAPA
jgi:anaerobic dimethyl sulfoxide reductase subunit A